MSDPELVSLFLELSDLSAEYLRHGMLSKFNETSVRMAKVGAELNARQGTTVARISLV
jgi:hypothetical protein